MPQGKRLTIDEALKRPVTTGAKPVSIDEALKRPVATRPQPTQSAQPVSFTENVETGAGRGVLGLTNPLEAAGSAITGLLTGDTQPLKELGKGVALGAARMYAGSPAGNPGMITSMEAAVAQAEQERQQQGFQRGDLYAIDRAVKEKLLSEREAKDHSLSGKITRGTVSAAIQSVPYLAAGPGGVPALAATGAAMSLGDPENLPLNVALATLPAPALGKFVPPILRRIRAGRNVPVAQEIAPAVAEAVPPAPGEMVPGVASSPGNANPTVQRAMQQFDEAVQRINASNLTPAQKAAELDRAIRVIGREAAGARPAPKSAYPPEMVMPENPNAIQQAGVMPRVFEGAQARMEPLDIEAAMSLPKLEADLGVPSVRAAPDLPYTETVGPSLADAQSMAMRAAAAKSAPSSVTPEERAALLEAEWEPFGRQPRQTPLLEGIPGPATEAERAALLQSTVEKGKPARQAQLFSDDLVAPAEKTKFIEAVMAVRKAGLLRITSHLKNIGGTGPWQVQEELARVPGAILDIVLSPATRRRTLTGPNLGAVARSAYEAATKGRREAMQIWRNGATADDLARLGLQREVNTGNQIVDWYVNKTFRATTAADRIFRVYAMRRSLEDRARSIALTEIHKGEIPRSQLGQRTRELVKSPTADMQAGAVLDADVATFNQENIASKGLNALRGTSRGADFAIDNVVPFAKTPTNVIGAMLEASPLGYGKNAYQIARAITKKSFTAEQQRQFAQTFGRATAGSGLVALGYVGYRDGWLTGLQEDDTSRRARDTATGRIPGAILVNGKWYSIAGLAPWGSLIAIGASIARETEQEQQDAKRQGKESSYLKQGGEVAKIFGKAALEQPMLAGTKQIIEGLEQPGTMGAKALGGLVGSYVPGHVSDVGQLIDYGKQREAQTLSDRVLQRIPIARQTLPEKLDVMGRPMEAPFPLDPTRGATAQQLNNPFFAELVRLDAGISGIEKGDDTDAAYRAKVQNFGQIYTRYGQQLVASPQYQRATDELRLRAVKILNEKAKSTAKEGRSSSGALSPAALIGAAKGEEAREKAKKNPAKR